VILSDDLVTAAPAPGNGTPVPGWVALLVVIAAVAAIAFAITMLVRHRRK
jgi:hypothetical protein